MLSTTLQASRRSLRTANLLPTSSRRLLRSTRRTSLKSVSTTRRWYTTEKIIQHRLKNTINGGAASRLPSTLYDASLERENCGVGMVASLKSVASRKVVMDANEMLVRMSHRGGVGCCPASGDGAGEWLSWRLDLLLKFLQYLDTMLCLFSD